MTDKKWPPRLFVDTKELNDLIEFAARNETVLAFAWAQPRNPTDITFISKEESDALVCEARAEVYEELANKLDNYWDFIETFGQIYNDTKAKLKALRKEGVDD